ncbi:MBL fold metallo-hydrolase [Rhodothermus marinus]|jgi:glyoxylase-like metal-dependent hydrolase (beta-lactamase superfamily II)|uniref:MBL fold metallo-hydrolase n=1 Tax=Rhodothermus marinus TaxID=29549 RepID=UPI001D9EF14A|nr:MBL fold metallo-hydrolase [Rhodothermus marinus]MBO2492151.1 MBL fold metallo-hydrolase [Rhodothermus marinus]
MNRRTFLQQTLAAALLPLVSPRGFRLQDDPFRLLRRNVGIFTGRGGTIGWLATADALIVVDAQFPETATQCWEGLHARTERMIDVLINTHHHRDHTAGNIALKPHARQIIAHRNVPELQRRAAEQQGTLDQQAYADRTFDASLTLEAGDERVHIVYYGPAHTGGDAIIHFEKANIVHVGDLVFNRMPCFIDLPGGATTEGWIAALERLHATSDDETQFIFGHGNPKYGVVGGRADLLVMRDFLEGLRRYVEAGIRAGKTAEELAVDRLPDFPEHYVESWPQGIPNAIRAVYQELSGS